MNWYPCASPHEVDSESDDDLLTQDKVINLIPEKMLDTSLSFHECQSPPNEDQPSHIEPPENMIDRQILERQQMLKRLNSVIGDLEKDVEQQDSALHMNPSTELSRNTALRGAKLQAKSRINDYYNMPQIDGCDTPDDLSPAKSPPKSKIQYPYSFGLDIFMYDEPEYLEAYSVASCPDLVFPYEYIV